MFQLNVLQTQWLAIAMAVGLVLVLGLALYYLAMWRERPDSPTGLPGRRRWFPPALLMLTYSVVVVVAVVYTLMMIRSPPNW